jgi:DNA-directed RNA polymerase specialized sigma24 family protein
VNTTNCTSLYCNPVDPSFFASLLETTLQPVLLSAMPARQEARQLPAWLTGDNLNLFLAEMQPYIERAARSLYFRSRDVVSVDLADLEQVGMIAAWQATQRYDASKVIDANSFTGYCVKFARGAMLAELRGLDTAISLDSYLEIPTQNGAIRRELPDKPTPYRQALPSERRRILAALRQLPQFERLAVMATYRIADRSGHVPSIDGSCRLLRRSKWAFYKARERGMQKLASLLGNAPARQHRNVVQRTGHGRAREVRP